MATAPPSSERRRTPSVGPSRPAGRRRWAALFVAGCLLGGPAGCGGDRSIHPVRGHVQAKDGRRATFGMVELTAEPGGQVASGVIEEDGSFRLTTVRDGDGAVAGRHRAIVVQVVNTEHIPLEEHHHVLDVHPRHGRYETSGLEFTIEPGKSNYLEIVVDEAPRKPGRQPRPTAPPRPAGKGP